MRTTMLALALLLVLATAVPVKAEVFQFVDAQSNSYLVYWAVWQSQTFLGYTDGYGRLRIDSPTGRLPITLKYRGKHDKSMHITVTDTQKVRLIRVQ